MSGGSILARWPGLCLWLLLAASLAIRLAAGWPNPTAGRYWDERYGIRNIVATLEGHLTKPANGYHPSLSHLPQSLLLLPFHRAAKAGIGGTAVVDGADLTPLGYRLCRASQAFLGVASLGFVFLGTRRLFAPWPWATATAWWATVLLSVVPWHVRQSVIYKPDILLLMLGAAVVWAALRALERPRPGRLALVGVLAGLALAAKFSAPPLLVVPSLLAWATTAGPLLAWRRLGRALLRALALLAVAGTTLLAIDPWLVTHPEVYRRDFARTLRDYARKAARAGTESPPRVAFAGARSLASSSFHGPLVAGAGALGLLALGAAAWRRGRGRTGAEAAPEPWRLVLTASFPLTYGAAYAVTTGNPSPHNWLPLSPLVVVGAAWLGMVVWSRLTTARVRVWGSIVGQPLTMTVIATLLSSWFVVVAGRSAYRESLPSTREALVAALSARLEPLPGRVLLQRVGTGSEKVVLRRNRGRAGALRTGDLRPVAAVVPLSRFDAIVAEPEHLSVDELDLLEAPLADAASRRLVFEPRFLVAWGPRLVAILPGWRPRGEVTSLLATTVDGVDRRDQLRLLHLPPATPGVASYSLELLRNRARLEWEVELSYDGRPLPLVSLFRGNARSRDLSVRFPVSAAPLTVRLGWRRSADAAGSPFAATAGDDDDGAVRARRRAPKGPESLEVRLYSWSRSTD